jgi:deoxyribose-phosphate aldolase
MEQLLKLERAFLDPVATREQLAEFCQESVKQNFWGILLRSSRLEQASHDLGDSELKISCLVGAGAVDKDVKRFETEVAVDYGAHEIYLIPAIAQLKDGAWDYVLREMRDVVEAADERAVKVMIEPNLLSAAELDRAVALTLESGAQYIVSSTSNTSALLDEIRRLRDLAGNEFGLIASVPDNSFDNQLLAEAGANRVLVLNNSSRRSYLEQSYAI